MGQDREATHKRLTEIWQDQSVGQLPIPGNKYILFSDLHLGNSGKADDFRDNEQALVRALQYYHGQGYSLILLGDIEEFWQFDLKDIRETYGESVYPAMCRFAPDRIVRIFGNHDSEWGALNDPATNRKSSLNPVAIKLVDAAGNPRVLLVHGHQGSTESDKNSWMSRFFVRLYKSVEPVFKIDKHSDAPKSQIASEYERIFHEWAEKNQVVIICGHSHRAIFASLSYADRLLLRVRELQKQIQDIETSKADRKKLLKDLEKAWDTFRREEAKGRRVTPAGSEPPSHGWYFNTGCGLYTDGITGIEIDNGSVSLVKWNRKPKPGEERVILQPEGGKVHSIV